MGVHPARNSLLREREDCGLLPRGQAGLRLGTLAAMWPGLTSPSVSPAPLPGPGLGLAMPLAAPARGWDRLDLLADTKPKEGRAFGVLSPAPLPGPGLGLATPLAAPAEGGYRLDLLAHAKPTDGRT